MTSCQFWIQTGVQIAAVVATLLVSVLAIWGDAIRARWVGPRLALHLHDPEGERIDITNIPDGARLPARYYHVQVTNERRAARATNVRVVLNKVSRPAADGTVPPSVLSGPVQLTWQHGHSVPQYPTIGPPVNADLGYLVKNGMFQLSTLFIPNNLDPVLKARSRLVVELLAVADETESAPLCVEIAWDGVWSEDTNEMRKHLVVKEVSCS